MVSLRKLAVLALCAALCLSMLSGCGGDSTNTLYIYNATDYIDPAVIDMFEEEMGCKVVYDTFESNESMYTKVKNGNCEYDLIFPSDYMVERMSREGLLEELNMDNIPNASLIDEKFMGMSYDPDNTYSLPYMWGTVGIMYNTTMVDEPITSWDAMWDEKYEGEIVMYDAMREGIGTALIKLGYDLNTRDESQLQEARDLLIEQKPLVLSYATDQVRDMIAGGEAAMALCYSGDYVLARQINEDLAFSIPEEGSNYFFDTMCILKGAAHKELAEAFINFLCRTDVAEMNYHYIGYLTPQKEVYANLTEEEREIFPDDETLARCTIYADLGEIADLYDQYWTEVLAAQ